MSNRVVKYHNKQTETKIINNKLVFHDNFRESKVSLKDIKSPFTAGLCILIIFIEIELISDNL